MNIYFFKIQAETELVKASAEFSKTLHNLEEKSTEFEKQKLHDVKSILLDFVSTEMGYHAKALEVLTNAYKAINSIDEEADLQVSRQTYPNTFNNHSLLGLSKNKQKSGLGNPLLCFVYIP